MSHRAKQRVWWFLAAALVILATLAWSSDTITLQDQWTIYTARCGEGAWQGKHCTGRLVAAERHHFVADKPKSEVAFDVIGVQGGVSGRLSQCAVDDGRNWKCLVGGIATYPITRQLVQGDPVDRNDGPDLTRRISKRQWLLLRLGLPAGSDAWR